MLRGIAPEEVDGMFQSMRAYQFAARLHASWALPRRPRSPLRGRKRHRLMMGKLYGELNCCGRSGAGRAGRTTTGPGSLPISTSISGTYFVHKVQ